jgi:hypothetical protein
MTPEQLALGLEHLEQYNDLQYGWDGYRGSKIWGVKSAKITVIEVAKFFADHLDEVEIDTGIASDGAILIEVIRGADTFYCTIDKFELAEYSINDEESELLPVADPEVIKQYCERLVTTK